MFIDKSDFSWTEVEFLFNLINKYRIKLFIETAGGYGDIASMMIAKGLFDPDFQYLGISKDISIVDNRIESALLQVPQAYVVSGESQVTSYLKKLINQSSSPVAVLCDGYQHEHDYYLYHKLLRPGDVLIFARLPSKNAFKLLHEHEFENTMQSIPTFIPSIFAGVLL